MAWNVLTWADPIWLDDPFTKKKNKFLAEGG